MRKNILICDDEEGIRESLNLILEKDFNILFATNGQEAVSIVRTKPVDIVMLDIKMPKVSGLDTLKELKKTKPDLKIIIATGYKSVETAQEAVRLGASDYIVKPFDSKQVLKAVKKHA
jgi:two-component system response regulator (stage 0 sporulation protein F)